MPAGKCACCGALLHTRNCTEIDIIVMQGGEERIEHRFICDACRRILCTCERCSAFDEQLGICRVSPSIEGGFVEVHPKGWCRDGWRQARPWTLEEARGWLGLGE